MTLNQVFDEAVRRMNYDPFCQALILELKAETEREIREGDNREISWDGEICSCSGRKEFLEKAGTIFTKRANEITQSEDSPTFKQATQLAETLRLIFERETGEKFPKIEIVLMGLVKIVKIPEGEAPGWVRATWLGLILPCRPLMGFFPGCGVVSRRLAKDRLCIEVPQKEALKILGEKYPDSVAWWQANGYPEEGGNFLFDEGVIQIIRGVQRQVVHQFVGKEEVGDGAADHSANQH